MTKVLLLATDKNLSRVDTSMNARVRLSLQNFENNCRRCGIPQIIFLCKDYKRGSAFLLYYNIRYESKSQEQPLQIKMLIKIILPKSFGGLDGLSGEALGKNFIKGS